MEVVKKGKGTRASPYYYIDEEDPHYMKGREYMDRLERAYKQKYKSDIDWGCYQESLLCVRGLGNVNKKVTGFEKTKSRLPEEIIEMMKIKDDDIFIEKVNEFEAERSVWV